MLSLSKHLYRSGNQCRRNEAVEMLRQAQHDVLFVLLSTHLAGLGDGAKVLLLLLDGRLSALHKLPCCYPNLFPAFQR